MKTILIVEDNALDREVLAGLLKNRYEIIFSVNSREMMDVLRKKADYISAILLDLIMPETDGFEALANIRENDLTGRIPVIISTGLTDEESQIKAMSLGANGYIFKPFNRDLLIFTLGNAIELSEKTALLNSFNRDVLTGILNRAKFFETADRLIKSKDAGYYILACLDIENFKVINDQYGVEMGDSVLKHVADILKKNADAFGGICCRYAADKFGILYPAKLKDSETIADMHREIITGESIGHTIRIRIGRYTAADMSVPISSMFDRATLAEESIRGSYDAFIAEYTDLMRADLLYQQQIVNDMGGALERGEFEPWLQPQYNHATGAIIGAEALVRWKKGGEYISPQSFVPVFERNGFIYEMDLYIWERVCVLLRRWMDEGRELLPVSVNISRRDLFHDGFMDSLTGLVKKYDIPYNLLRLEVTESAFAEASRHIIEKVGELIELGFTVEIDDFGSGYSSLNTLKDVPASILKLDMKFFENTKNQQRGGNIVESVVRMAKWLGMAVIAEGVEEQAQADYLRSIGCYYIQGYFYAKPMPAEEYEELLSRSTREPELTRLKTLKNLNNSEFWNPKSMETLIFNSYVGGACIFEYSNGKTELLRVNEQYSRELGKLIPDGAHINELSPVRFLDEENKALLYQNIHSSIDMQKEASCDLTLLGASGGKQLIEYIRITSRLIARADERYLFYCVIVNTTKQHIDEQRRREAEKKQLESARQLEVLMKNINGGVSAIQIDDDGTSHFVFTNEKYFELYGYAKEEAFAEKFDVMGSIVREDFPSVMSKVKKLKTDGISTIIDYRIIRRGGSLAYLRANASLMFMEGYGNVIAAVVVDITETRALEEQLRAVVGNINGGVTATVIRNGKPEFIVVNDQFFKMLGYDTREQYDAALPDKYTGIHPKDRERIIAQFESSDGGKTRYTMEYRIIRKDGTIRYIRNNISVIHLFGVDEPVQLSVANDITDLLEAEQRESEAADKLSVVLNHAGNGITAIALRGDTPEFLLANDKYYDIVGYTREDYARATQNDMLAIIHPEDREALREKVTEFNSQGGSMTAQYRVIRGDGKTVWLDTVITITNLAGVDTPVQVSVFSDITAEKQTSDQLRFLNDSAHDILAQPDSGIAISKTLENLLAYFAGDRAYVMEIDSEKQLVNNTYEKCAKGVTSEIENLQNIPIEVSTYWFDMLDKDQYVVIDDVEALSDDKAALRSLLLAQSIHSIIIAPLWREGVLMGFVGIDNPSQATDQLGRLRALGDYIAVLLTRRDLTRKIEHDSRAMQLLMDDTPGGFMRMELHPSANPTIVSINDGFCRMLGMTRSEVTDLCGGDAYKCLVVEDITACSQEVSEALCSCGQFTTKCRLRRKDGSLLWAMVFGRFVKNDSGRLFLNSYFTDISAHKQAEDQQKELLDNLPCGAGLYDFDGQQLRVVHVNRRYQEMVGREVNAKKDLSVMDVIHPNDIPRIKELMSAQTSVGDTDVPIDIRIRHANGTYHPYRVNSRITRRENEKWSRCITFLPISDEKLSMQQMMPYIFPAIMESSMDMAFAKDKSFRYLCCSHAYALSLGLADEASAVGKTDHELFPKEMADRFREDDIRLFSDGKPILDKIETIRSESGLPHYTRMSKYLLRDSLGNILGIYGIGRDITERQEKNSQLNLLTNTIPGGLATFSCSPEGNRLEYFNVGLCRLFGCTKEDLSADMSELLSFIFDEDRQMVEAKIAELIETDTTIDCVYRIRTRNGGFKWVNHKAVAADRSNDTVIVNAVFLDVTEQQEEKERLRVSEELNRLAIAHSGNIITRFDVKTRTLALPESFDPIFVLPHMLKNMPEEQIALGRISPDTADIYRELFESIVRGESTGSVAYKQNSTKGWRWLEAQYTTVFSSTGEPVSAVISFSDITERLEKEVVYNKWQQSLNERPEDSYTLFRCNLSKSTYYDSREGNLLSIDFNDTQKTFDELTTDYARKFVYEEDRRNYLAFLNSDTLLAEYYRGSRSHIMEYRELFKQGLVRWLRLTVDLVEYPSSKDVEIYLMFEDIDEQKKAELLTQERSEKDSLTGILNRSAFIEKMEHILSCSSAGDTHALLMLDVDNFKTVNDTLGHGAGDRVLRELTIKMGTILRRGDLIGRLGGDEFFVFLKDISVKSAAAEKARQICALKIFAEGSNLAVTASIGIAMIPSDGSDFDTLYKKADDALYRRKEHGKNGFLFAEE